MQSITIFALALICIGSTYVEAQRCPTQTNCDAAVSAGTRTGNNCGANAGTVWAHNSRTGNCDRLNYLGCGGTANRFCSEDLCRQRCIIPRSTRRTTRRRPTSSRRPTPPRTTRRTTRRTTGPGGGPTRTTPRGGTRTTRRTTRRTTTRKIHP